MKKLLLFLILFTSLGFAQSSLLLLMSESKPDSLGDELNAEFHFNTVATYTAINCSLATESGQGKITQTSTSAAQVRKSITVENGKSYRFALDWIGTKYTGATPASIQIRVGTSAGGTQLGSVGVTQNLNTNFTIYMWFTATQTSVVPGFIINNSTGNSVGYIDNFSIRESK